MLRHLTILLLLMAGGMMNPSESMAQEKKYNKLTANEQRVILHKGTESPGTGKFNKHKETGTYVCRQCNAPLYKSDAKFDSGSGWPSFDDEIPGAVKHVPDVDGRRVEIVCANCGGHLGHVFEGERFTPKNTRHCVNSVSLDFLPAGTSVAPPPADKGTTATASPAGGAGEPQSAEGGGTTAKTSTQTAVFGSGCFWGTEYMFQKAKGVLSTRVGYTGGSKANPTYKEVSTGTTGHAEAMEVVFDPKLTSYEELARLFFETHDPTQIDRQGPDIGDQYRSGIYYQDAEQKQIAEKLRDELKAKGLKVATEISPASTFWPAEEYHQKYYQKTGKRPYCHSYKKLF